MHAPSAFANISKLSRGTHRLNSNSLGGVDKLLTWHIEVLPDFLMVRCREAFDCQVSDT